MFGIFGTKVQKKVNMIKGFLNDCENSDVERVLFACLGRWFVEYELCNAVNFNTGMHVHKKYTLKGPRPLEL